MNALFLALDDGKAYFNIHTTAYAGGEIRGFLSHVPGDYNYNGVVDAADYVVWRQTFGDIGDGLAADPNNNNIIDNEDYTAWRENFGQRRTHSGEEAVRLLPPKSPNPLLSVVGAGLAAVPLSIRRASSRTPVRVLVQRLLRLCVVLAGQGEATVVFRCAVELGGERLGILGRERAVDRSRELLVLVHVDDIIRRRLSGAHTRRQVRPPRRHRRSQTPVRRLVPRPIPNLRQKFPRRRPSSSFVIVHEIEFLVIQIVVFFVGHGGFPSTKTGFQIPFEYRPLSAASSTNVSVPAACGLAQMPERPLLTARWTDLLLLNFAVPAEVIAGLAPPGTEPDLHEGQAYISVVGFQFQSVRLFGLPIPGHTHFNEINLRYYVKRIVGDEVRRGVVFVREIVPRRAVAIVANRLYNENYVTRPMRSVITMTGAELHPGDTVEYAWQSRSRLSAQPPLPFREGPGEGSPTRAPRHAGTTSPPASEHPLRSHHQVRSMSLSSNTTGATSAAATARRASTASPIRPGASRRPTTSPGTATYRPRTKRRWPSTSPRRLRMPS